MDDTGAKAAVLKDIISWSREMKRKHGGVPDDSMEKDPSSEQPPREPDADEVDPTAQADGDADDTESDGADSMLEKLHSAIKGRGK